MSNCGCRHGQSYLAKQVLLQSLECLYDNSIVSWQRRVVVERYLRPADRRRLPNERVRLKNDR